MGVAMTETSEGFRPVAGSPVPPSPPEPSSDDRNIAMLAHLSALVGLIGIPLGNVLGPLIVWLVTKDRSPFVDDQGKEALNFQIAMAIAAVVLGAIGIVGIVLGILIVPLFLAVISMIALVALMVFVLVVMIQAAMAVNKGEWYRYPVRMTFVR